MFESSNIRAIVFDLDGTLLETEHLKAEAYAELIGQLTGHGRPVADAIELYRSIVGATDLAVCKAMIERFSLESILAEQSVGETPIEAMHRLRMKIYVKRFGTAANLRSLIYPHNIELARSAHGDNLSVGVATMSFSSEARRVLDSIGISDIVETIVGVDQVEQPKPSPEAFLLAMERLEVTPGETLVVEDSARGALAADASGARWICVATEFSKETLRNEPGLDQRWIVQDPNDLNETVLRRIAN